MLPIINLTLIALITTAIAISFAQRRSDREATKNAIWEAEGRAKASVAPRRSREPLCTITLKSPKRWEWSYAVGAYRRASGTAPSYKQALAEITAVHAAFGLGLPVEAPKPQPAKATNATKATDGAAEERVEDVATSNRRLVGRLD